MTAAYPKTVEKIASLEQTIQDKNTAFKKTAAGRVQENDLYEPNHYYRYKAEIDVHQVTLMKLNIEYDKLNSAFELEIINDLLQHGNNPYLKMGYDHLKSWGVFFPYLPDNMVETLGFFFRTHQLVSCPSFLPNLTPEQLVTHYLTFDSKHNNSNPDENNPSQHLWTICIPSNNDNVPAYAFRSFDPRKMSINELWQDKTDDFIVNILKSESPHSRKPLLSLPEKNLVTVVGNHVNVLMLLLKICRIEQIGKLLPHISPALKQQFIFNSVTATLNRGKYHFLRGFSSKRKLAIFKELKDYCWPEVVDLFCGLMNSKDRAMALNEPSPPISTHTANRHICYEISFGSYGYSIYVPTDNEDAPVLAESEQRRTRIGNVWKSMHEVIIAEVLKAESHQTRTKLLDLPPKKLVMIIDGHINALWVTLDLCNEKRIDGILIGISNELRKQLIDRLLVLAQEHIPLFTHHTSQRLLAILLAFKRIHTELSEFSRIKSKLVGADKADIKAKATEYKYAFDWHISDLARYIYHEEWLHHHSFLKSIFNPTDDITHVTAILDPINALLTEKNISAFSAKMTDEEREIVKIKFGKGEQVFNTHGDRPYLCLESDHDPKKPLFLHADLYVSKQLNHWGRRIDNQPSYAVLRQRSTKPIPLTVYWDSLNDDEVKYAIETFSEHATKATLFDLDDRGFAPVVNQSAAVLRYYLRSAPTHQTLRVLQLSPLGIPNDKIKALLTDMAFLKSISSGRLLFILKNIKPAQLLEWISGDNELNFFLVSLNAKDKAAFIDYFGGELFLPTDLKKFAAHPDYHALHQARMKRPQHDISKWVNPNNNPHYAKLGIFHYPTLCDRERFTWILEQYGFTSDMLTTLPEKLSIDALRLLIYLVTGLPPEVKNYRICPPLELSRCLPHNEAIAEFKQFTSGAGLLLQLYAYGVRSKHLLPLRSKDNPHFISPFIRAELTRLVVDNNVDPFEASQLLVKQMGESGDIVVRRENVAELDQTESAKFIADAKDRIDAHMSGDNKHTRHHLYCHPSSIYRRH